MGLSPTSALMNYLVPLAQKDLSVALKFDERNVDKEGSNTEV